MSMKSEGITSKNFGGKLSGVIRSATTMRDKLQQLILFGMEHYAGHGDTGYLDRCMEACVGVKAFPTQKMKAFIQHHANVSYREVEIKQGKRAGEKTHVFKKRGKEPVYDAPATMWYNFSTAGDVVPDLDVDARILNLVKTIDKKLEAGKVKNPEHARTTKKTLVGLCDTLGIAIS